MAPVFTVVDAAEAVSEVMAALPPSFTVPPATTTTAVELAVPPAPESSRVPVSPDLPNCSVADGPTVIALVSSTLWEPAEITAVAGSGGLSELTVMELLNWPSTPNCSVPPVIVTGAVPSASIVPAVACDATSVPAEIWVEPE